MASDVGRVSVTVEAVPGKPVARPNSYRTKQDAAIVGNVVTDDTGDGADLYPDGLPLTVSTVQGQPVVDGTVRLLSGATQLIAGDGAFFLRSGWGVRCVAGRRCRHGQLHY